MSLRPAIPVICPTLSPFGTSRTINVPGSSGALVLRIRIGIPASLTGKIDSSCKTLAPLYANSRSSRYVIISMRFGFSTILGSAIRKPETSVQFSYKLACTPRAMIAPVISEPPRENVLISPFGLAP